MVLNRDLLMQRVLGMLAGVWSGMLLAIALIATPSVFYVLADRRIAGNVAGLIFGIEARVSLAFAIAAFALERNLAERRAESGQGSRLSAELLLVLGALFCTVLGHFALQPMIQQARQGLGSVSFATLHAVATSIYGLKVVLVMALAWLASGRCVSTSCAPH